jgi:hypothetical protein
MLGDNDRSNEIRCEASNKVRKRFNATGRGADYDQSGKARISLGPFHARLLLTGIWCARPDHCSRASVIASLYDFESRKYAPICANVMSSKSRMDSARSSSSAACSSMRAARSVSPPDQARLATCRVSAARSLRIRTEAQSASSTCSDLRSKSRSPSHEWPTWH